MFQKLQGNWKRGWMPQDQTSCHLMSNLLLNQPIPHKHMIHNFQLRWHQSKGKRKSALQLQQERQNTPEDLWVKADQESNHLKVDSELESIQQNVHYNIYIFYIAITDIACFNSRKWLPITNKVNGTKQLFTSICLVTTFINLFQIEHHCPSCKKYLHW